MKKIIRFFIFLLCISLFSSLLCSSKQNKVTEIKGFIRCTGNEPFVYPYIITDDEKQYIIICSEEKKQEILDLQGYHVELTGIKMKIKDRPFQFKYGFELISWKKLNDDEVCKLEE
ncbi:MAG: hypothetical protein IKX23_04255 [Treponema sp.]|nr:hypothetical protein [Treponema sp.]